MGEQLEMSHNTPLITSHYPSLSPLPSHPATALTLTRRPLSSHLSLHCVVRHSTPPESGDELPMVDEFLTLSLLGGADPLQRSCTASYTDCVVELYWYGDDAAVEVEAATHHSTDEMEV